MSKTFTVLTIVWLIVVVSIGLVGIHMATTGDYESTLLLTVSLVVIGYPIGRYLKHHLPRPAAK
ncbi:MAG: hypothetical protein ABF743_11250 [Schleiferilactobacillus perolens]|uniref:hypothetical protein n=1 Tax=Schleiferilactobacillus perolens TaxID=100468 RepID=UPI0039E79389